MDIHFNVSKKNFIIFTKKNQKKKMCIPSYKSIIYGNGVCMDNLGPLDPHHESLWVSCQCEIPKNEQDSAYIHPIKKMSAVKVPKC